jgi:DnaJ-class molecular chaperone
MAEDQKLSQEFLDQLSAELETVCEVCEGDGGWRREDYGRWHRCWVCEGAGYTTTPFGEKVLALMRHNFRPMLEDCQ